MRISENIVLQKVSGVDLPWVNFRLLDKRILYLNFKPLEDEFDLKMAKTHAKVVADLLGNDGAYFVLNFQGTHINFSNDAREFFASDKNHTKNRKSQAIVIDSLAHKLVANFYLRFNKPKGPTKVFEDLEAAFQWTLSL